MTTQHDDPLRHETHIHEQRASEGGALWFIVGALVIAIAVLAFVVIDFGEPVEQPVSFDNSITLEPAEEPQAAPGGDAAGSGGAEIEEPAEVPATEGEPAAQ